MQIIIDTIPHDLQRYNTVGDWYYEDGIWHIKVSTMSDWRHEFLVAFHEMLEMAYCHHNHITQQQVDEFDRAFEENRQEGNKDEPGNDKTAPYYLGHKLATMCETLAAQTLDVDWESYNNEVENL